MCVCFFNFLFYFIYLFIIFFDVWKIFSAYWNEYGTTVTNLLLTSCLGLIS